MLKGKADLGQQEMGEWCRREEIIGNISKQRYFVSDALYTAKLLFMSGDKQNSLSYIQGLRIHVEYRHSAGYISFEILEQCEDLIPEIQDLTIVKYQKKIS